jgi:hypothetical protein
MRRVRLLLPLLPLALAACDLIGRPPIEPAFGDPYVILVGAPAETVMNRRTPLLTDTGRLVVVVEYRGGCSDHGFRLDYALADGEARLWIAHDDPGDPCSEAQREELAFELNEAVLDRPSVVLVPPEGANLALQADGVPLN